MFVEVIPIDLSVTEIDRQTQVYLLYKEKW